MMRLRQSVFRHRLLAMLALVLAFALRALIPQGMMTAPDAAHGITVLICDSSGTATRLAVPIGDKQDKAASGQSCPFAILAQTAAAETPAGWIIAPFVLPALPLQIAHEAVKPRGTFYAHPPARAPPVAA